MYTNLCVGALALGLSLNAFAGDGVIGPIKLDSITVIAAPVGSHKAGNMEIAVTGGFVPPPGVNCSDHRWITTLKTADPDRSLLSALQSRDRSQTIRLFITDESSLTAFPNRCSIKGIEFVSRFTIG